MRTKECGSKFDERVGLKESVLGSALMRKSELSKEKFGLGLGFFSD